MLFHLLKLLFFPENFPIPKTCSLKTQPPSRSNKGTVHKQTKTIQKASKNLKKNKSPLDFRRSMNLDYIHKTISADH